MANASRADSASEFGAWVSAMKAAIGREGMSLRQVAELASARAETPRGKVNPESLRKWLANTAPRPEAVISLADALDEQPLRMLELAGYLPRGTYGIGLQVAIAADRERRSASMLAEVVRLQSRSVGDLQGTALFVRHALDVVDPSGESRWAIHVAPCTRGKRHRIRYLDYLTFELRGDPEREAGDLILSDFEDHFRITGAAFERAQELAPKVSGVPWQNSIFVPRLMATRAPDPKPVTGLPVDIFVLGTHWSGDDDLGAVLGELLGYGHAHTSTLVRQVYREPLGRSLGVLEGLNENKRFVTRELLRDIRHRQVNEAPAFDALPTHMVWIVDYWGVDDVLIDGLLKLDPDQTHIVHLAATDSRLSWAPWLLQRRFAEVDIDTRHAELVDLGKRMENGLAPWPQGSLTRITTGIPAAAEVELAAEGDPAEVSERSDDFVDDWVDAAVEAWADLKARRGRGTTSSPHHAASAAVTQAAQTRHAIRG